VRRLFELNSEPHTGARPSVRLCVGLIKSCEVLKVLLVPSHDAEAAARSLVELGKKRLEIYEAGALAQAIVERAFKSRP
jgi:hypothetical protein